MRVLDAGCGTGETLMLLHRAMDKEGLVVGVDLAAAHTRAARAIASQEVLVIQADLQCLPLLPHVFDLIWSVNTINHLRDTQAALQGLLVLLRPGGRIAVGQSSLLPEMYFAWDSQLERVTMEAVRHYYRHRYSLSEQELAGTRALLGWIRNSGLKDVSVQTTVIERMHPLDAASEAYILEAIFRGTWGERLRPFLAPKDYNELAVLCDPAQPGFALRRNDFHFLQTLTMVSGTVG
jgi:SAM-dependent methyltransferase